MIRIALRAALAALVLAAVVSFSLTPAWADDCNCPTCNDCNCSTCNDGCAGGCAGGCYRGILGHDHVCHGNIPRTPPPCRAYGEPYGGDLFYNFYSQGLCDRTAGMYPSPYPTPLIAGRTYITYQPLMPHEYMYWHHRSYHRYYDGGKGLNRTLVKYSRNPAAVALGRVYATISIPR